MFGGISYEGVILYFQGHRPRVYICDVKICEDIYTTQNAFYTIEPSVQNITKDFLGRSILYAESNDHWRSRRKAMTPAFYKDRLRGIVKLAASTVKKSI